MPNSGLTVKGICARWETPWKEIKWENSIAVQKYCLLSLPIGTVLNVKSHNAEQADEMPSFEELKPKDEIVGIGDLVVESFTNSVRARKSINRSHNRGNYMCLRRSTGECCILKINRAFKKNKEPYAELDILLRKPNKFDELDQLLNHLTIQCDEFDEEMEVILEFATDDDSS